MRYLKNHPRVWMDDAAALAIDAYEDKYGVLAIESGGRTEAEQQKLIDRWDAGGKWNRPPFLYPPARPASASNHVGGRGIDVANFREFREHSKEFGFVWFGDSDPVHFNFIGWTPPTKKEDENMLVNIQGRENVRSGGLFYVTGTTAKFLGPRTNSGVPTLSFDEGTELFEVVTVKW